MEKQMEAQELLDHFQTALDEHHIIAYYQPQINHATGRMVGAEALMRWIHPEYGMQFPLNFIPVLEENGLIRQADLYIFEEVCKFIRFGLDRELNLVPISFNVSRYDLAEGDYVAEIEAIREKYRIPTKYLRAELTESSAIGSMDRIIEIIDKLHDYGYIVEMDDFGSGYSSLNVLKDLNVDIIKLDMRFLSGDISGRGGTIISAILQMSRWLNTPVIAEGVETLRQADYMQSIGCNYIQGYLYSKPITAETFRVRLEDAVFEPMGSAIELAPHMHAEDFWNPDSLETLIFNNFVGGAAIFTYQRGNVSILRVNEKYLKEIGMALTEEDIINVDPWTRHSADSKKKYENAMKRAIMTDDEVECENWRHISSKCCGEEHICIRSTIRVIGRSGDQYIFYASIRNITTEKRRIRALTESELKLRFASEQVNVYAWEFEFATKVMRPCFRCMRDLNLPPIVENYPESVFEAGIFPEDYREKYFDMIDQLKKGAKTVEAVIPLTVGRIPFHVRYTTEFDENGKPYKAFGSAALVVDDKPAE